MVDEMLEFFVRESVVPAQGSDEEGIHPGDVGFDSQEHIRRASQPTLLPFGALVPIRRRRRESS
jgi:hypothetical protein